MNPFGSLPILTLNLHKTMASSDVFLRFLHGGILGTSQIVVYTCSIQLLDRNKEGPSFGKLSKWSIENAFYGAVSQALSYLSPVVYFQVSCLMLKSCFMSRHSWLGVAPPDVQVEQEWCALVK